MKSDKRKDIAARALEKGVRMNERATPDFRTDYPDFIPKLKNWIASDPVLALEALRHGSGLASFNQSRVGLQRGQEESVKSKRDNQKDHEQVLVDLARPYTLKVNVESYSYIAVADYVKRHAIPRALRKVRENENEEESYYFKSLNHLANLSKNRIYRIILKHKESLPLRG